LAAEPGGPAATVEVIKKLMGSIEKAPVEDTEAETNGTNGTTAAEDISKAEVAGEVADTAEKLDSSESKVDTV